MNAQEALAELERMYGRPTSRAVVWDSLTQAERSAIVSMAEGAGLVRITTTDREAMLPETWEKCWQVLERFARLSVRITVANDNARAEEVERARQLIGVVSRRDVA